MNRITKDDDGLFMAVPFQALRGLSWGGTTRQTICVHDSTGFFYGSSASFLSREAVHGR